MDGISWIDGLVVVAYFAAVITLAVRLSRGQRSTHDFFLGGRALPWWAAALSTVATETSAVTFIGVPLAAYTGDWSFLQFVGGYVLGRVFLALFFLRAFYRQDFETVYGYLGDRFSRGVQTLASVIFLCGRVIASAVRLFAGCLALQVAVGGGDASLITAIVVLGVLATLVTYTGGVRAVIWTDVVLGLTFVVAALGCVVYLVQALPAGLDTVFADPEVLREKTRIIHWGWEWSRSNTLCAGLIGGFVLTLATHGTDQDIVQRLLTCNDSGEGRRAILGSAVLIVPLVVLFLSIGTFLYFHHYPTPPRVIPEGIGRNELLPRFIVEELPLGFRGFVIAGLLAASFSSLTSVLNALASTTINDLYRTWRAARGGDNPTVGEDTERLEERQRRELRLSRLVTLAWGAILTAAALLFVGEQENVLVLALKALMYFYGGLLGAFLLGLFSERRGSPRSVGAGMLAGVFVVLHLQLREFLVAAPETLSASVRALREWVPSFYANAVTEQVPEIAWPYWILVGAVFSAAFGALGTTSERSDRD